MRALVFGTLFSLLSLLLADGTYAGGPQQLEEGDIEERNYWAAENCEDRPRRQMVESKKEFLKKVEEWCRLCSEKQDFSITDQDYCQKKVPSYTTSTG